MTRKASRSPRMGHASRRRRLPWPTRWPRTGDPPPGPPIHRNALAALGRRFPGSLWAGQARRLTAVTSSALAFRGACLHERRGGTLRTHPRLCEPDATPQGSTPRDTEAPKAASMPTLELGSEVPPAAGAFPKRTLAPVTGGYSTGIRPTRRMSTEKAISRGVVVTPVPTRSPGTRGGRYSLRTQTEMVCCGMPPLLVAVLAGLRSACGRASSSRQSHSPPVRTRRPATPGPRSAALRSAPSPH